jgi:WD40 repeat protein
LSVTLCLAGGSPEGPVPSDTCVVRLLAPPTATVLLDGRDQGTKRTFSFEHLNPDSSKLATFDVTLPGHPCERRDVVLLPGECVTVPFAEETALPELVLQVGHSKKVTGLVFSPDGRYLFSGADGGVAMWDVEGGKQLRFFRPQSRRMSTSLRFETEIHGLAISPDGRRLLAGVGDECAHTWDVATGQPANTSEGWLGGPYVAISKDGRFRALGAYGAKGSDPGPGARRYC